MCKIPDVSVYESIEQPSNVYIKKSQSLITKTENDYDHSMHKHITVLPHGYLLCTTISLYCLMTIFHAQGISLYCLMTIHAQVYHCTASWPSSMHKYITVLPHDHLPCTSISLYCLMTIFHAQVYHCTASWPSSMHKYITVLHHDHPCTSISLYCLMAIFHAQVYHCTASWPSSQVYHCTASWPSMHKYITVLPHGHLCTSISLYCLMAIFYEQVYQCTAS